MGLLRLYLALCVVAGHSEAIFPWLSHDATEAVQIFYMISGFYMSLVAHTYASSKEFYVSRFLRIFIPYYLIAFLVVAISCIGGIVFNHWGALLSYVNYSREINGLAGVLFVSLANITILFQDMVLFLAHEANGPFAFVANFADSKMPLYKYLIIPQAWSVGVELLFYLFVPLLTRLKTKTLAAVIAASFIVRILTYEYAGLSRDPWTYRFFPFELALFGLGMVGHRLYERYKDLIRKLLSRYAINGKKEYIAFAVVTVFIFICAKLAQLLMNRYGGVNLNYSRLISYSGWTVILPALFFIAKDSPWDRFIGELSYPVYLIHIAMISYVTLLMQKLKIDYMWRGGITALFCIITATALMKLIITPFENKRHFWAKQLARIKQ